MRVGPSVGFWTRSPQPPHTFGHVDYSHGVRLVPRTMELDGLLTTLDAVLADLPDVVRHAVVRAAVLGADVDVGLWTGMVGQDAALRLDTGGSLTVDCPSGVAEVHPASPAPHIARAAANCATVRIDLFAWEGRTARGSVIDVPDPRVDAFGLMGCTPVHSWEFLRVRLSYGSACQDIGPHPTPGVRSTSAPSPDSRMIRSGGSVESSPNPSMM